MALDRQLLQKCTQREISLEEIDKLDHEHQFTTFNSEVAWELGSLVKEIAETEFPGRGVAIDVSLISGQRLFRCNSKGNVIKLDNDNWIRRKQNTVKRFGFSSFYINVKKGNLDFREKFFCDPVEYAFHGGAIPLYQVGCEFPFAILTCSGLAQEEDYVLGLTALKQYLA